MREFKGDWKDLFNGFVLALDFRKMFLGFLGIVFTLLVCGTITLVYARNLKNPDTVPMPGNLTPHEMHQSLSTAWHVIYTGHPTDPKDTTPWGYGVFYTILIIPTFLLVWGLFGGAIARIAAYEIARDGERIETAKALKFSWTKFSSFFMAPMICVLGFLFFFVCNVVGGALSSLLDCLLIGGPLGAILLPLALLSGFIMVLIGIGSLVGAPLFFPAVAAEGTDSFDAMSRGFSYVYSRPWHFAWYQIVSGLYGWVCVGFVLLFTVMMCYVGVRGTAAGFDWVARWRDENMYGMRADAGKALADQRQLYNVQKIDVPLPPSNATQEQNEAYEKAARELNAQITAELMAPAKSADGRDRDLLVEYAERTLLDPSFRKIEIVMKHLQVLAARRPALAALYAEDRVHPRTGDSRLYIANDKAWDLVLSRRHTSTELYDWNPRALMSQPHPYGRLMFILNCSITWDMPHGGRRSVGIDRTLAGLSADQLSWSFEMKLTYWIICGWLILAMGLAYGYAVSYFISQQTVIYFLLRKKVDGIEMNEVFEEPEDEEPLPDVAKPADAPKPAEGEKKS